MKRIIILLTIVLTSITAFAQLPGPVIGTAVAIPAGSFNCTQSTFPAPVGVSNEGDPVTMCFNYYNIGPVNLSFILVSGLCGPFPLYNTLNFSIYDSAGTTFIISGTIVPTSSSSNTTLTSLIPSTWYTICYTWVPNCPQFSGCPLIYTSALPIDLLYFNGSVENNIATLVWATASEISVDRYQVSRSSDLVNYTIVGSIESTGDSQTTKLYRLVDGDKITTTTYYKLTEITENNNIIDHKIIAVNPSSVDIDTMQIYDIFGREVYSIKEGVNIIKKGNAYYKVIQVN